MVSFVRSVAGMTRTAEEASVAPVRRSKMYPLIGPAVFEGDRHVAAIIKGLFESFANLLVAGERRNPAFEVFLLASGDVLELISALMAELLDPEVLLLLSRHGLVPRHRFERLAGRVLDLHKGMRRPRASTH